MLFLSEFCERTSVNYMPQILPLPRIRTHTRSIGIVYPPPDIRNIVDKTSKFVAKNGPESLNKIINDNSGNAACNFLNASNPYHAYYHRCLSEVHLQYQPSPQEQPAEYNVDATRLSMEWIQPRSLILQLHLGRFLRF